MDWTGRPVLVTGAGGFIGSHLVDILIHKGAKVRAFVRYNSRGEFGWLRDLAPQSLRAVQIIQGDLRDAESVAKATAGVSYVFHLGAMIAIPYSYINPSEAVAVNVVGTMNVLNASRAAGIEKIVHTSTSETYGTAQYVPIDEDHPMQGQSPYSASKIGADKLAESYFRSFGLPVATIRPFNTYGPRQSARAVIPTIIAQLLSGKIVRLGSLTTTRDFTYVEDTARGILRTAEVPDTIGKTINLGTSQEISIADLVKLIEKLTGKSAQVQIEDLRVRPEKSEVQRLLSNNTLARHILGWRPEISLDDGLERTIAWMEMHLDLYHRAQNEYVT